MYLKRKLQYSSSKGKGIILGSNDEDSDSSRNTDKDSRDDEELITEKRGLAQDIDFQEDISINFDDLI